MIAAASIEDTGHGVGLIGPNAITRILEALDAVEGRQTVLRIFAAAGLEAYLFEAPTRMVDEAEVIRLHGVLRNELGDDRARSISRIAGQLTAEYLLRHRIPGFAQIVLRLCPAGIARRVLARAIAGNAWTFVGSGTFSVQHRRTTIFTIRDCPICRAQRSDAPCCDFYAATFERLYARLVNKRSRVIETNCQAMGAPACTFEVSWRHQESRESQEQMGSSSATDRSSPLHPSFRGVRSTNPESIAPRTLR